MGGVSWPLAQLEMFSSSGDFLLFQLTFEIASEKAVSVLSRNYVIASR